MITIISGTNRLGSNTKKVANYYNKLLQAEKHLDIKTLYLEDIDTHKRSEELIQLEKEILIPSQAFIFIFPEYNGSFPGVLKSLIDHTDIRKAWWYKKALLVGVADGRGGNLRGLDQLSNVLHYLKMYVHPNKLPLSKINQELNEKGEFKRELTRIEIENQIDDFLAFLN
ncbi:MAG TPA: NAD(P)H-dependent oxidoreductase [Chitinophagaceae bacterium]|nr:NAD(P)H-dependent oxidoreductase [Chitinophagaceae bacterium]